MSRIKKTAGFIIRSINYGDTSRIISVLSQDEGKVSFMAKGARKIESKFGSALELLTLTEFVYYQKEGLKLLSQASTLNPYSKLKSDYDRLEVALRTARWLQRLLEEDHGEPSVFLIYKDFLEMLCSKLEVEHFALYELSFKLKVLASMGLAPTLDRCALCNKAPERSWFSLEKGGLLCQNCRSGGEAHERPLHLGIAKGLNMLLRLPFEKLTRIKLSQDVTAIGTKLIDEFTSHHLRPLMQQRKHLAQN